MDKVEAKARFAAALDAYRTAQSEEQPTWEALEKAGSDPRADYDPVLVERWWIKRQLTDKAAKALMLSTRAFTS
jgi:hypothetical protein